jgi:hypothetical protein
MFRDGFVLVTKKYKKQKPQFPPKKVMKYSELVSLLDIINATEDKSYIQHIDDPFALMLLFGVYVKVDLPPGFTPSDALRREWTCEEVWDMIHNPETDWKQILMSLTKNEQFYLQEIVNLRNVEGVTARDILREFSKIRAIDLEDAYTAWRLQPDPQAMSYAILSTYTLKNQERNPGFQRITPAAGLPVHLMYPAGRLDQIRYPCAAFEVPAGERAQLHKDGPAVRIFDDRHNILFQGEASIYSELPHDGVFDGFWDDGSFRAWDVIQINDVWMYNGPLYQRLQYLWRLGWFTARWSTCLNPAALARMDDLWEGPVVVKNLNTAYDPALVGAWIEYSAGHTVLLKVSRVHRGDKTIWTLMTEDGVSLFQFGGQHVGLTNKDRVVEVTRSGKIVRHRPDLGFAQEWDEVQEIFEIEKPEDLVPEGSDDWVKKSLWRKLSVEQGF